ncbi:DUF1631 domain-containing protein [Stenotrophomonas nitritireducens]|uniref:Thymidine phosphorylase n=1 Tax=Stenotrophomonas nitritireducens TaxID=83617 RepID=A0ABR5NLK0_9GAMM|nr:DUF1631 domain-containing protein [Stenotrophomonas nitritireducens]KRG58768.1 thymidine phosphorylase [Stenotrophomonas nitritireducens]
MSGITASSSSQALARLAGAQVPERVRHLLEAVHGIAAQVLASPLQLTMVQLERELFGLAEKARNSQVQADVYAQIRQLGVHAAEFPGWFLDALADDLARLREPSTPGATPAPAIPAMTLVNDTDIDRDIVLHEMARRESYRAQSHLQLLGQRFGVLCAQPAFDAERLPVGPHALCRILRACGERLGLNLEAQQQLYHVFERQALERHVELLDRLNILLAREGVLPGLVYIPYLPRPAGQRRTVGAPAAGATREGQAAAAPRPLTHWQGQAPAASWADAAMGAMPTPAAPAPASTGPGPGTASAPTPAGMASLHELLDTARQLLAQQLQSGAGNGAGGAVPPADMLAALAALAGQQRPAGATAAAPGAAGAPSAPVADLASMAATLQAAAPAVPARAVPSEAVMDVLARLQPQGAAQGTRRSFGDIQKALLSQVRAEHGQSATLSPRDSNTLDLLGMLYGQIQREVRADGPASDLLNRLQVPLARAAVGDEAFFIRDQHPARELLNTVAESGAVWLGEDDGDPVLLQKLGEAVDRVVAEYQGDESVFAAANRQVQSHLQAAVRKAEVTERRQIEAARGKERLEAAKQLAGRTIGQLCSAATPPRFVQTLLHEAWSDVLTLTLLRQGEDSEEWRQRQEATRRIGEITASAEGAADPALGGQIEESLLQVGYHEDEAGAIARRLSTPGGEDEITSRTELAARLKARARLGGGDGKDGADPQAPPPSERTPAEEGYYRQLRTLPFGTWFEFTTNQQGDTRRLRLSWYSLVTDNALFVNQRGQKMAEHSLDALARLMARDQLRIVTEDRGRLIDRAWQATVRALRSLAGGHTAPESA